FFNRKCSVLFFYYPKGQTVDKKDNVGPALIFVFDHCKLIDRQSIISLEIIKVHLPSLGAANLATTTPVLDGDAVGQATVEGAVSGDQVGPFKATQSAIGLVEGLGW